MDFLFPAGLAASALAVPLVALYFLRLRRRRIRVPSLLPWHAARRSERLASPLHRFRRNLLLLVQLLLLALLVLALARPYLETGAAQFQSVVLVVDTSASMGATDARPTRLARAADQAVEILDRLGPTDEAMLVTAGPRTEVVVPFTRDRQVVQRAVRDLEATEAEGDLEEALELALSLARSRPDVEIAVLSDGGPRDLGHVPVGDASVRFLPVGESDRNGGIVALDLRRSPVSDLDRQLFVTVRWFGTDPTDGSVEVYLEGELTGLRNTQLEAETPVSMVFDLPADATGSLEVRFAAKGDVLPADDRAWAVLSALGDREVILVGGDALTARILANDPRLHAVRVAPADAKPEVLRGADCVLFAGGAVPDGLDGLPYAVLGPFPGSPVRFGDPVRAPRITGWQRTSPLLRFTRWDDVRIGEARDVTEAGGLVPVVDAETGPLVLAGTRGGARVVQLAFDPLASDLPMRVAWPVFVLNTVTWLTEDKPAAGEGTSLRTGTPYVRGLGDAAVASARVRGPAGVLEATVADGLLRVADTDRVGVYTVDAGTLHDAFAANLLSEAESRVRPRSSLGLVAAPGSEARTASVGIGRRELWRPLLLAAVIVLGLEWLLWNLRRSA